ncbi:MAG: hypothetical protein ABIY52_17470 [Gemmatimonadaceae bacterium]
MTTPLAFARRLARYARRLLGAEPAPKEPPKRNKHLWSIGVYSGSSPLTLGPDSRFPAPAITRDDVTDVSAGFVADPFLIEVDGVWHLFFEVFNRATWMGEVALATSPDLVHWTYRQVVLREPFHISYPLVFEWEGAHYMMPEMHKTQSIRLYRAEEFPLRWTHAHTIMSGERFADSTPFRHDDRWWLFTETNPGMKHDTLRLYYADELTGPWTEHPKSPVIAGDPHIARPAGMVVATATGLVRFAQDCAPRYGLSVHAFEITTLTTTDYAERAAANNPIMRASGSGWNEAGMHHVCARPGGPDGWVAAVDGWEPVTMASIAGTT